MLVKVRDKESGREALITKRAYELRKNKYTFLGYTDDEGNDLQSPNHKPQPQVQQAQETKEDVNDAAPAASEVVERKKPGPKPKNKISSQSETAEV